MEGKEWRVCSLFADTIHIFGLLMKAIENHSLINCLFPGQILNWVS
jgi:hypothetical protein